MIEIQNGLFASYELERKNYLYGEVINQLITKDPRSDLPFYERARLTGERLASDRADPAFAEFPVLRRLGDELENDLHGFEEEFLRRITEDAAEISRAFLDGRPIGRILSVSVSGADSHNHCQMTAVVHSDAGSFVYKPHSLKADRMLYDLAGLVLPGGIRLPRAVDRGAYGYSEFIVHEASEGPEHAAAFYRNAGIFAAFAHAIGITDLHCENFLASGDHPVLVDMETVLRGTPASVPAELSDFQTCYNRSVAACCLLPQRLCGAEFSLLFSREKRNPCAPTVDGRKVTVSGYEDAFFGGFESGYRRILGQREQLAEALRGYREVPVRIVIRNTSLYGRLLQQLTKPGNLRSEADFEKARAYIRSALERNVNLPGASELCDDEIRCLSRGEIPYYFTDHDGADLFLQDGKLIRNFLRETPLEAALCRLRAMSPADLAFQERIFRLSFTERVVPRKRVPAPAEPFGPDPVSPPAPDRILDAAEDLLSGILDRAAVTPAGKAGFVMSPVDGDALRAANFTYNEGSLGIAVFLAAMLKADERLPEERKARIRAVLDDILEDGAILMKYVSDAEGNIPRTPETAEIAQGCAVIRDFGVTGLPANLLALCSSPDRPEQPPAPEPILPDQLPETDTVKGGSAGTVLDLIAAGRPGDAGVLLARMLRRAEAENGFRYLEPIYEPAFRLSFMSGAAGIGYTLLRWLDPETLADPR